MRTLICLHDVIHRLNRDTRGAIATEYTFLIAFVAILAALGMVLLGTELNEYFAKIGGAIGTSASQGT
jgi:Flp pilus assembly pilin Flp